MIGFATFALALLDCHSPSGDAERMQCARAELAAVEDTMNRAFAREIETARINDQARRAEQWSPSREARLRAAQDVWLRYRQAQCTAEFLAPAARSLEEINRIWCQNRLTKERTNELNINFIVD